MAILIPVNSCCASPEWLTAIATSFQAALTFVAAVAAGVAAFYAHRAYKLEQDGSVVVTRTENHLPELFEDAFEIFPRFANGPNGVSTHDIIGLDAFVPDAVWRAAAKNGSSNFPITWLSFSNPGRTPVMSATIAFTIVASKEFDGSGETVEGKLRISIGMISPSSSRQFAIINAYARPGSISLERGVATSLSEDGTRRTLRVHSSERINIDAL